MSDALAELDSWCRKYYSARVVFGPFIQPGDEGFVELIGRGGRKVVVDVYDCPGQDEDGLPTATTADMIREALRRWDADETPKRFHVMVSTARPVIPSPAGCERWASDTHFQARIVATNDADAMAKAVALFDPADAPRVRSRQAVWERGPAEGVP